MPSEADLRSEEIGPIIERMLAGRADVPTEDRMRILRLIGNMTLGCNAVGYLTESLHGVGSPLGQRIQILRGMDVDLKRALARKLAGVGRGTEPLNASRPTTEACTGSFHAALAGPDAHAHARPRERVHGETVL